MNQLRFYLVLQEVVCLSKIEKFKSKSNLFQAKQLGLTMNFYPIWILFSVVTSLIILFGIIRTTTIPKETKKILNMYFIIEKLMDHWSTI